MRSTSLRGVYSFGAKSTGRLHYCTQMAAASTSHQTQGEGSSRPPAPSKSKFVLPKKIERGRTDLLKALSDTVGDDPTGAHYAFVDDPSMIPSAIQFKRVFATSREMGKRAAREFAQEWPTLFMYDRDEPRLDAFRPKPPLPALEDTEPNEENLLARIQASDVIGSVALYDSIRSDGAEITDDVRLQLLELICFYNGQMPPLIESEWTQLRSFHMEDSLVGRTQLGVMETTWTQQKGVADLLFQSLKGRDKETAARAYSAIICGMCKYSGSEDADIQNSLVQKARDLYKEAMVEGLQLSGEAYQWLLTVCVCAGKPEPKEQLEASSDNYSVGGVEDGSEIEFGTTSGDREEGAEMASGTIEEEGDEFCGSRIIELLEYMKAANITPNVTHFNAALRSLSTGQTSRNFRATRDLTRQLIGELLAIGLQPTLTTYKLLLELLGASTLETLDYASYFIGSVEQGVRSSSNNNNNNGNNSNSNNNSVERSDFEFYTNVMKFVVDVANNLPLAKRLMELYKRKENMILIPNQIDLQRFFSNYVLVCLRNMPQREFAHVYTAFVPKFCAVNVDLCGEVAQKMMADAIGGCPPNPKLVIRLFEDFLVSHSTSYHRMQEIFRLIHCLPIEELPAVEKETLKTLFMRFFERVTVALPQDHLKQGRVFQHHPKHVSEIAALLLRFDERALAWEFYNKMLPGYARQDDGVVQLDENAPNDSSGTHPEVKSFGYPLLRASMDMVNEAIQQGDCVNACNGLEIIAHYFPQRHDDLNAIVQKMRTHLPLGEYQKKILRNFVSLRE